MNKNLKLTFLADTHHYSQTLGITGKAYELRSGSDQKCLAETGAIIDAAFEKIAKSDTDAVLIAGDLSNDGELKRRRFMLFTQLTTGAVTETREDLTVIKYQTTLKRYRMKICVIFTVISALTEPLTNSQPISAQPLMR